MFTLREQRETLNQNFGKVVIATTHIQEERRLIGELDRALDALKRTAGLEGHVVAREAEIGKDERADALIEIKKDGTPHRYLVEAKTRIDRVAALGHLKARLNLLGDHYLLFAPYITTTIARQCRDLGIEFLDAAGNAFLKGPGLYVFVTGEKPEGLTAAVMGTGGGGTATAHRVVFALLCKPELLNAPYREIVDVAGVALGAVGWVFFDLEARGLVAGKQRKHNRRFLEPTRLFDEWVTNYPIKLRPKLNPQRFRAPNPDWWRNVELTNLGAIWGGEIAAARMTYYLKPEACTIYLDPQRGREALTKLVAANRLRADPEGNVEILDKFWNFPADNNQPDIAPAILVYADLVASLNPRNLEVATLIRERHIDHALRQI